MPRYHFNLIGKTTEPDETGTELPSAQHAKEEGIKLAGALLGEGILFQHGGAMLLEVLDHEGAILFHLDVTTWETPAMRGPASDQACPVSRL